MSFRDGLFNATGLNADYHLLTGRMESEKDRQYFLNSGVWIPKDLAVGELDFDMLYGKGDEPFFKPGQRMNPTVLNMPENCVDQGPHCHPGGELAMVLKGSYFDADMSGKPMRGYGPGDIDIYGVGSTHRPLSETGARLFYIPFDGIVFGATPEELVGKMKRASTSQEAMRYALHWMVPDVTEREDLSRKFEL